MNTSLELTVQESRNLEQYEERIERGFRTFVDVGDALLAIRDERLYREQYRTFGEYCNKRWGFVASRARQLIAAAKTAGLLSSVTTVTPTSERQVRPLAGLSPEQQQKVWEQVVAETPAEQITGAVVQEAVDRIAPKTPEYRDFEREELRPHLHDAGLPGSPQILSGECDEPEDVPDEQQERAEASLRDAIIEQLEAYKQGRDADECADGILEVLGKSHSSVAIAARIGIALALQPQPLSTLVDLAIRTCGKSPHGMGRDETLRWRKRVLRLLDGMSYAGGVGLYQHEMANGQLCFGLMGR